MRNRNRAELAARLHQLARAVEGGRHPVPRPGTGPLHLGGAIAVPPVVHDLLCGWRVRVRLHTRPPVRLCAGCGLAVLDTPNDPAEPETTP